MKKRVSLLIFASFLIFTVSFLISYNYSTNKQRNIKSNSLDSKTSDVNDSSSTDESDSSSVNSVIHGSRYGEHVESYIVYDVKKGDCLNKIYKENIVGYPLYKAKDIILSKNNMKSESEIVEGIEILIPQKDIIGWIEYRVKPLDTLDSIVNKFYEKESKDNIIAEIIKKNSLEKGEEVEVDQRLLLPDSNLNLNKAH